MVRCVDELRGSATISPAAEQSGTSRMGSAHWGTGRDRTLKSEQLDHRENVRIRHRRTPGLLQASRIL